MVIGFGYVTNQLKLPFRIGGEQRILRNELTARLDLSIRDNSTIQRRINNVSDTDPGQPNSTTTNGGRQVQLRYSLSE
jgi:hypothetical protein